MKFPKIIYISRMNEHTRDEYLVAHADEREALAEDDGPKEVATYELKTVRNLEKTVVEVKK